MLAVFPTVVVISLSPQRAQPESATRVPRSAKFETITSVTAGLCRPNRSEIVRRSIGHTRLEAAAAYEQAKPWSHLWPALGA